MCTFMFVHVHEYVLHINVCVYVCMYVCMYSFIYSFIHSFACVCCVCAVNLCLVCYMEKIADLILYALRQSVSIVPVSHAK